MLRRCGNDFTFLDNFGRGTTSPVPILPKIRYGILNRYIVFSSVTPYTTTAILQRFTDNNTPACLGRQSLGCRIFFEPCVPELRIQASFS